MSLAKTADDLTAGVTCTGPADIPAAVLAGLCRDLRDALAASYANVRFAQTDGPADAQSPLITLVTFVANDFAIDALLTLRAEGGISLDGPRMALSISDKKISPTLQLTFISRLVKATALPL